MEPILATLETRFSRLRPAQRTAAAALLVAVGYYVGANLGIILRFPPSTPSVIWPPNSILTATLLLAPRRRWWIYLLAALPAHLAAELPAWPAPLVLSLFATNCSEALLAALYVRQFSDAPALLDTLRRVVVFIAGAALVAPFVSSFADAAAVASFGGEPYWLVWRTRFSSNVLTELTVAPAILTAVCALREPARRPSPRRRTEAALLGVLLLTASIFVFAAGNGVIAALAGPPVSPLAWLFPFLLWAAVRFGPLGASLSLLTTTLVAIWAATHARGLFARLPVAEYVPSLQLILSVVAIPLMCLAALIEERRRVESALAERLRFEEFLSRLSAAFVHLPSHELDAAIAVSLRNLGEFLQLDRVVLLRFDRDSRRLAFSQSWAAPGFDSEPQSIAARDCPAAADRLLEDKPFVFSRERDAAVLPQCDVRSSVTLPLLGTGRTHGVLALDSIASDRSWPEELLHRLQLVAEIFASVLARKEAEDALRASELMKSAILSSLSSGVAVLDRQGQVIAVNESWTRLGADAITTPYGGAAMRADYLELQRCSPAPSRSSIAPAADLPSNTLRPRRRRSAGLRSRSSRSTGPRAARSSPTPR